MTGITDERTESQSATEQVKERVQDVAGQAKGQTREQLRNQISQRSTQAGEQVSSAAGAMRRTSEQLRSDGQGSIARIVDGAAPTNSPRHPAALFPRKLEPFDPWRRRFHPSRIGCA